MKKNNMSNKSQIWFTDFAIAIVIFSLTLISYYQYTTNISKQDSSVMVDLISDAKSISSYLTTGGYPTNWNSNNVVRIGFTDNYNRIDNAKFVELTKIGYNKSKKLLGTPYEYFLYFINESGDVQNIEGFCGTGNPAVNITYDIKAAYYYQGPGEEEFLKTFMVETFQADVYYDKSNGAKVGLNDQSALIDSISDYDFVVVEHPYWNDAVFKKFVDYAEPWVQNGGILFLGGEMGASQISDGFDIIFKKLAGASSNQRTATVINEDPYINFNIDDEIVFNQFYYIEDDGVGSDLVTIAIFKNEGDKIGLARWPVGEGKILFFSDFDSTYLAGNFQEILEGSVKKWANAMCLPIDITNINRENLVRLDRLLIHNSDQVKMVLYLWQ